MPSAPALHLFRWAVPPRVAYPPAMATLVSLAFALVDPPTELDVLSHALIQLVGSGGLGTLLLLAWSALKTKLDDINEADVKLGERIDALGGCVDAINANVSGRLDNLQLELERKANSDAVDTLGQRLQTIETAGRERSRRLVRVEAKTGLLGGVDDVPERR